MNLIFIIFSIPYAFHFLLCFSKFILLLCKAEVEFAGSLTDVYTYLSRVTVLTCQSEEEKHSKKNVSHLSPAASTHMDTLRCLKEQEQSEM